jgi:serine protease Do
VTAAHVIEDGEVIEVDFKDGTQSEAAVVTLSRSEDIALLKVAKLPAAPAVAVLGDSDTLKPGQRLFAIGAPLGLEHTLTMGVVSALRSNPAPGLKNRKLVQTDVSLNQGNSGGPLFNEAGEVVGIASFLASLNGGNVGLNFAVPSNTVRARLFEQALPYVGLSLRFVSRELAELLNWPVETAFLVEKVKEGSAAFDAGLKGGVLPVPIGESEVLMLGGDLITSVGELDTTSAEKVGAYLRTLKAGSTIRYGVLRGGKPMSLDVRVPEGVPVPQLPKAKR